MPVQVPCYDGNATLSQGENFEFINYGSTTCNITACSPPLVNSNYSVGPATTSGGSTCPAQVQHNAPLGQYNLTIDCCSSDHAPIIVVQA